MKINTKFLKYILLSSLIVNIKFNRLTSMDQNTKKITTIYDIPNEIISYIITKLIESYISNWDDIFKYHKVENELKSNLINIFLTCKKFSQLNNNLDNNIFNELIENLKQNRFQQLRIPLTNKYKHLSKEELNLELLTMLSTNILPPPVLIQQKLNTKNIKECVAMILAGATVNTRHIYHNGTTLFYAVINGDQGIVRTLINYGADVNITNLFQETPLIIAAKNGSKQIAKILIKHNANPNTQDLYGKNPLMHAILSNNSEIVNDIIAQNIDINAKDHNQETALIYAAKIGNTNIVKLLIARNADTKIKDNSGKTALQYAKENKHKNIVKLLKNNNHQDKNCCKVN